MSVKFRSVEKSFMATEQAEGVGAKVRRSIGTSKMETFSPFLMMDHFNVLPPAGFPDHPHHGQETITYVMQGMVAHEDFTGARGVLGQGDLQFMTAGKGIVHSEMPVKMDNGQPCIGMQLWVDLPKKLKNTKPRYRDLRDAQTPVVQPNDKVWVKVIAGQSYGTTSKKDLAYTPVHYYHFKVWPGGAFEQEFPDDFNVFLYMISGSIEIDGERYYQNDTLFFKRNGQAVKGSVLSKAKKAAEFVLIGGQVLDQPVFQYGPFVETTREKIAQVIDNFQRCVSGFERAKGWSSKIRKGVSEKDLSEDKRSIKDGF